MPQLSEEAKMIIASNLTVASQIRLLYWEQRKPYEPATTKSEDDIVLDQFDKFRRYVNEKYK